MSSISSLKLTTPIAGETTYTSPVTDLFRFNSLAYSAFYSHASLAICNLQLYFSTDNLTFTLYKEITLDNEITSTGNELIPSRYFRFQIENPAPDAMTLINIQVMAHKTATSNIDVNIGSDDITISGVATETTQLAVKGVLDNIKTNTDNLVRVSPTDNNIQQAIPVRLMVGTSGSAFNALRSIGSDLAVYIDDMGADVAVNSGLSTKALQETANTKLDDISFNTLSIYNLDKRTFNLPRSGLVLHNSVAVSADTTSTQFIIGQNDDDLTSKDIYNTIQLNGRVPFDSSYSCVLEFSNDGVNYFSDHIEPDIKRLGTSAYKTFSLTRTNVCSTYARVYHLQSATELFLQASLMRY